MSRLSIYSATSHRLLWRDWKSGELNILLCSLLLAIATVTCISLFTSRIHSSIYQEASTFLAADAKIKGSLKVKQNWREKAQTLGLESTDITYFRAMAFSAENMVLTQVKAVAEKYPLKGSLTIANYPFTETKTVTQGPKPGELWLAARLFSVLDISVGDKVDIGEASFIAAAAILKEPDSGQSIFGVAPRIMMHIDDISATQAVQIGSRINYEWLLIGNTQKINEFKNWIEPKLGNHFRWIGVKGSNISLDNALTRAERFLLLTGCLSVILSGVAVALAARRYAQRRKPQVALLKTLGCTPNDISKLYFQNLLLLGIASVIVGSILGWLLHWVILHVLGNLIPDNLEAPSILAYSTGAVTGFIALWAFAAPPIFSLRWVAPAQVLREADIKSSLYSPANVIAGLAAFGLMYFYSRDIKITFIVAAASLLCVFGVGVFSYVLIHALKPLNRCVSYSWRMGLASLKRHRQFNTLQIVIFSLLFMLLFILVSVRTNLLSQWQEQLPEGTPNHFIFNIFPDDIPTVKTFFTQKDIDLRPFYPMTRGRVTKVNGVTRELITKEYKGRTNYERELNLTWSNTLNEDNKIVAGKWWNETDKNAGLQVSAEKNYAEGLDINIGDKIEFSVAGQNIAAEVASIRSVQWDSMNPNFYMVFDKPLLDGSSANWITSFFLTEDQKPILNGLTRQLPTLSLIEIDQTIMQVQNIVGKVSLAVEFILLLVLIAGILVLITSIQATLDLRMQEGAIYRTLGASKILVRKNLLVEFCTLGFISGLLAVLGTELCQYFLQTKVFRLDYQMQYGLLLLGPLLCTVIIGLVGWISARKVVSTPPLTVLRNI
ncbi:MAG: ABC transporter permease [Agarilytica sp.]